MFKPTVSLQPASLLSSPPQHSAGLLSAIILALRALPTKKLDGFYGWQLRKRRRGTVIKEESMSIRELKHEEM